MLTLKIIVASTRPGRKGPAVAAWVHEIAKQHPAFQVELVDLAQMNLPLLDEPNHPRLQKYEHAHTKQWSQIIDFPYFRVQFRNIIRIEKIHLFTSVKSIAE